jgi:signal transduction histidine kinase
MARLSETGGRASKAKARRASHAKGRKTAKTSPNDKRRRNAGRETEVARLKRELKEALARQTATSEILHVISQSPTDVRPVFDAIVLTAMRLFRCDLSFVMLCDHTNFWVAAAATPEGLFDDLTLVKEPIDPSANFPSRAIVEKQLLYLPDWSLIDLPEHERQIHERIGVNSALYLPLLREGECIGLLTVGGKRPGSFGESEIALAESFRDQALIAIEKTRLFNETKEALERQTATADILKVIASSPSDVQPVFEAIAERSKRLVDALSTTVFRLEDGVMHLRAFTPTNPEADATLKAMFPAPLSNFSWSEAIGNGEIYRVVDTELEIEGLRELARLRGYRSMLFVPLLRDRKPTGLIAVTRIEPGPFVEHHVQLLQTFADQAVIAIENVRLFDEVQDRTRELSRSLEELRSTQDRLVQTEKLASLGQLTAGIAHEIKNPLNFVNNFSALSAELIDELDETLAPAPLDQKMRGDVGELTQMLKANLEKVVQHGKRADSIVKNMLLHSREGSGEHRPADINALVEESLNLAYHGARAEKPGFNVTLKRDLDPEAGAAELYPQEITRALLNLISNGFYAATQRKSEEGETFEPVLTAATKNLGKTVEIRIHDNGTGIPSDVREKMFNPFFTTKPSGEGTGLGLSMSHDIIVKQHGGSVDVETEPGLFTEFRIVLPRTSSR